MSLSSYLKLLGWRHRAALWAQLTPSSLLPQNKDTGPLRAHTCAFPLEWGKHTLGVFGGELWSVSPILGSIFCFKCIDFSYIRMQNLFHLQTHGCLNHHI